MKTVKKQKYGWQADLPDHRDFRLTLTAPQTALPDSVDLRPQCPDVYDQGQLGSCTANAIAAALEFDRMREKETAFMPSRLFIYYNERNMEGTINTDAGAQIRDGVKSVAQLGVCLEKKWPYNVGQFTRRPTAACYKQAIKFEALIYERAARDLIEFQTLLASGLPFVFGFTVYESFESQAVASTGIVEMPKKGERCLGGHAVMAVGYDKAKQHFLVRNSWGSAWGVGGYFWLPFGYFTNPNLSDDFWVIRTVK